MIAWFASSPLVPSARRGTITTWVEPREAADIRGVMTTDGLRARRGKSLPGGSSLARGSTMSETPTMRHDSPGETSCRLTSARPSPGGLRVSGACG